MKLLIKGFTAGMKTFGEHISTIVNAVLLTIVYIVGVGLSSLIAKLGRKTFLQEKIDKKAKTYWEPLKLKKEPLDNYYRQF